MCGGRFMKFFTELYSQTSSLLSLFVTIVVALLDVLAIAIVDKAKKIKEENSNIKANHFNKKSYEMFKIYRTLKIYKILKIFLITILLIVFVFIIITGIGIINDYVTTYNGISNQENTTIESLSDEPESDYDYSSSHDETKTDNSDYDEYSTNDKKDNGISSNDNSSKDEFEDAESSTVKIESTTTAVSYPYAEFEQYNELVNNGIVGTVDGIYYKFSESFGLFEPQNAKDINVVVHVLKLNLQDKDGKKINDAELKIASKTSYFYKNSRRFVTLSKNYNGEKVQLQSGYYYFWVIVDGNSYYSKEIKIDTELPLDSTYTVKLT